MAIRLTFDTKSARCCRDATARASVDDGAQRPRHREMHTVAPQEPLAEVGRPSVANAPSSARRWAGLRWLSSSRDRHVAIPTEGHPNEATRRQRPDDLHTRTTKHHSTRGRERQAENGRERAPGLRRLSSSRDRRWAPPTEGHPNEATRRQRPDDLHTRTTKHHSTRGRERHCRRRSTRHRPLCPCRQISSRARCASPEPKLCCGEVEGDAWMKYHTRWPLATHETRVWRRAGRRPGAPKWRAQRPRWNGLYGAVDLSGAKNHACTCIHTPVFDIGVRVRHS